MADEKDLWGTICERAGIEREPGEQGPPTHIPMTILFAWHPTRDNPNDANPACALPHATKPTVFQVGAPVPLKPLFLVLAIFDDGDSTIRVYALPKEKQAKPEDNIPLRWTLTRTTTTMSVAHFPDPNTFLDTIAAELIAAEAELEDVDDPEDPPAPAAGGTPALPPPAAT
jgi:hypothetical protein